MCCPVCGMVHIKDPLLLMVCLIIPGLFVIAVCLIYIVTSYSGMSNRGMSKIHWTTSYSSMTKIHLATSYSGMSKIHMATFYSGMSNIHWAISYSSSNFSGDMARSERYNNFCYS